MGWLNWFVWKQNKYDESYDARKPVALEKNPTLCDMARILSNGDEKVAGETRILGIDAERFKQEHEEWCAEMEDEDILNLFAYWVSGYSATGDPNKDPTKFGVYIDWKEDIGDILWCFSAADKNLRYGLDLDKIKFTYEEFTDQALQMIADFLAQKALMLVALDTQSDCYHLFVIKAADYEKLTELAKAANFRFFNKFWEEV